MKKILFLLTICTCISSCNNGDIERLEKENESLKAQIAEIRQNQQNQIGNSPIKTTPQTNTGTIAKTTAQQVVKDYLLAGTAKERSAFVLNPKEELPRMEKMYGEQNISWANHSFQFGEDRQLGDYILVAAQQNGYSPSLYALKNEGNKLKIDWSVSQLLNGSSPMFDNIKMMQLDMDSKKHSLLVITEAAFDYKGAFIKDSNHLYSFYLDDKSEMINRPIGYCEKTNSQCQKLFTKLKSSKGCIVLLEAWYPDKVLQDEFKAVWGNKTMAIDNIQIKLCW